MQITFKQREIEAALRQYIQESGINLAGKTVAISFTAGRKEGGLTADVEIEDANQPTLLGVGTVGTVTVTPAAPVAPEQPEAPVVASVQEAANETPVEAAPAAAAEPAPADAAAEPASLFG